MHDRKHLCHLGKARGRIELSMIVTYFQCLTLRVRSGHLSNALTRERSWLTEKLVSPPYQSQSVVDSFTNYKKYPPVTPLWANSTTVRRPLDKMKPKDWFRHFFLFIYFIFSFFLRTQVARNKTSGYTVTKYPPVTPLWANSTTVRPPLGKMKPKDWFRQFLFYFRTQVARNKTSGYMVTKYPPVTPLWANSTTVRRPLDKMKPKDWLRQFFVPFFILFSDSSCKEQDIWLSWL